MSDLGAAGMDARSAVSSPAFPISASEPAPRPLQELLPQLSVEESATRCAAVNHLARSPHAPFLVEPLLALLDDERPDVRRAAISALGESADARALQPLRALLKGTEPHREDTRRALRQLGGRLARRNVDARNPDAPQAIETAGEIRKAIGVRKLRVRLEVRKGVRLKLASLALWAAGVALFGFGVGTGAGWAIVAGIAFGLLGFGTMEYADRYMPGEGLREYATYCDPDLSQGWAVGIALGGGLDGGGGGLDG